MSTGRAQARRGHPRRRLDGALDGARVTSDHDDEIRRTLREVGGYWRRAGMPRRARDQRAGDVQAHLEAEVASGRSVRDAVGGDVARFASHWAQASHRWPRIEAIVWTFGALTLAYGLLALLGPVAFDHDRVGFDQPAAAFVGTVLFVAVGLQMLRRWRYALTTQQAALIGVGIVAAHLAVITLAMWRSDDTSVLVSVAPVLAWALVGVGLACQAWISWAGRRPLR